MEKSIFERINFAEVLSRLSKDRPVFYSENDFQFALSWKIKELHPDISVRLEKKVNIAGKARYLDISLVDMNEEFVIELKYKTKQAIFTNNSEEYILSDHLGHGNGRYDFIKDISRIENYGKEGVAIFLTNDHLYWDNRNSGTETLDERFRIHQDVVINGEYDWLFRERYTQEQFMNSVSKERINEINIKGKYVVNWENYSGFGNNCFRYLIIHINRETI